MNFYKRFIGDITAKTGGLSMAQMGAYDRLLDHYYSTESPIAADEVYRICRAMSKAEKADVDAVLTKFWDAGPTGYTQSKADEVIAKALPLIEAARANGKKGGRPKKPETQKEPSGLSKENPAGTQSEPRGKATQSQIPDTYSEPKGSGGEPPTEKSRLWAGLKTALVEQGTSEDLKAAGVLLGKLAKQYGEPVFIDAARVTLAANPGNTHTYFVELCERAAGKRQSLSRHTGFDKLNYREGVNADGSLV